MRINAPNLLAVIAVLLLAVGCEKVDVSTLPEVPRVRFDSFLPGVQAQLTDAYAAVDASPASAKANGHLAMLLQTYKQFIAADVMYARVRQIEPDRFDWAYLHGIVLGAVGKRDDAIAAFRHALTLTENYPLAKIRLADELAERGEIAEAAQLFDEVVRDAPPISEVYFSHGKFLLRQGQIAPAIAALTETLRLSGPLGTAYYQLGLAYRELGDTEAAQENFALAKKHEGYAADSGDRILNKLLPLNLSDTPFVHRAKVLAENGRFDEAQQFIEMALERNPDSVAAHASMIGMAVRGGDFALADEHFNAAAKLAPDNAKIYFNLGLARLGEKRFVEAQRAFADSIERDATDPNAHVQLALLQHKNRKPGRAQSSLATALELDPAHPTANWLTAELLYGQGDRATAIAHLEKAVAQAHVSRPLMLVLLARARFEVGALDAADDAIALARADLSKRNDPSVVERLDAISRDIEAARASGNSGA